MLVDLLHLCRSLRRSPASAAAAIVTLSLTLGAAAAIFAIVDAVVLTPPPFSDPDSLVTLGEVPIGDPAAAPRTVTYATFEMWRDRARSLAAIEAADGTNLTLTGLGTAERITATNVTPGFLALLGVTPVVGRSFDENDVGRPVAIVSHAFWRGKLGADGNVIGRQLVLGGRAHTIVGVLPEKSFVALGARDLLRPFPVTPDQAVRSGYRVGAVARLARNVAPAHLAAALDDVSRTSAPPARAVATSIATAIAGGSTRTLGLLSGGAALALLVAFTNLAGLLIVRSIDRRRELAVRSALGARRSEIVKLLLLEAEALVVIGTAGGIVLALWITPVVGRLALAQFGDIAKRDVIVSWRVIGIVSMFASACAMLCAALPALAAARRTIVDALHRGVTPPPKELVLRRVFVAGEVALAFVLLVSMTLVGRSLLDVLNMHPGFEAHGVLKMQLSLPAARYATPERVASFYSTLQRAVEERLGARTASIIDEIPLTHDRGRVLVSTRPADLQHEAVGRTVARDYFDVMRIPIVAGRAFSDRDDSSSPRRIVISESLARSLFADDQVVGRQLWIPSTAQPAEIIGIVGDVKLRSLDEIPSPTVYLSALQSPSPSSIVVVRSARSDADVIAAVREEVARLDRDLPVYGVQQMRDVAAASPGVPVRRVLTAAFAGFAALALVLGAIGLFGVAAHDVASRRMELALRIALGADPRHLVNRTLAQAALMVGSGLVIGSVLSLWTVRALSGTVVGSGRFDAASVAIPAVVLLAAAGAAVLPTALRAARTDPLIALRSE